MKLSLETKITTFATLTAGGICAYLAPRHYLPGLLTGIVLGTEFARRVRLEAQGVGGSDRQLPAIKTLSICIPEWRLTHLNLIVCALLVSKITAPIFSFVTAFCTGVSIAGYLALDRLATWAERTQNERVLDQINTLAL